MQGFELPSNIRQIGSIADGLKIYMEDYVCTYLKQYADAGGHCEKLAFLVGKDMLIDGQRYIFISGAIQGRYSEAEDGNEVFTEKSYAYCAEQLKTYFPGLNLIGWMQSQPGYGVLLNPAYADYHMENFTAPCNVLFVMDPEERLSTFFAWDDALTGISETSGYYIYYDKNPQMQAYMTENRLVIPRAFDPHAPKPTSGRMRRIQDTPAVTSSHEQDATSRVLREDGRRKTGDYKRVVNMLVSLSAVLVVVCFIMGAGLAQSDGRISKLEKDLSSLNSTYSYLVSQVRAVNTMPVFAGQEPAGNNDAAGQSPIDATDLTAQATADGTMQDTATDTPTATPIAQATATPVATPIAQATIAPSATPIAAATEAPAVTPNPATQATPSETAIVAMEPEYDSYIVQQGDSLLLISHRFYGTANMMDEIMELNGMTNPDTIYYGKVLKLPKP